MSTDKDLSKEASEFDLEARGFSGSVYLKRYLRDDPTKYVIFQIDFHGADGLKLVMAQMAKYNLVAFQDGPVAPPKVIKKFGFPPRCPVHETEMRRSTRSGWFCPQKLSDGTFCKEKVK